MSDPTVPSSLPPEPDSGPAAVPPVPSAPSAPFIPPSAPFIPPDVAAPPIPPVPPQSTPQPAPAADPAPNPAPAPAASGTGLAPNIAAGLACFFSLLGGIVFIVLEKKDQFVRFWAMQALILGGAEIVLSVGLGIIAAILGHLPWIGGLLGVLLGLVQLGVGLGYLVLWVMSIVKSFSGAEWEMPIIGKIAREQLARMDGTAPTTPPAA